MTAIWCMVPQIWSATDRIFCYFGPLLPFYPHPQQPKKWKILKKWKKHLEILSLYTCVPKMKIIWCMIPEIWSMWQTEFLVILDCFLPFYPYNNPKNQNFEKLKKIHGYIIILYKCTKHHDHCSLDMACNKFNCYFSFWAVFYPFTSPTARKIKILKKWRKKRPGDIIILQ